MMNETKIQVFVPFNPDYGLVTWHQGLADRNDLAVLTERHGEILTCGMTFCAFWRNRPCTVPFRTEADARGWLEFMAYLAGNNAVTEAAQQTGYGSFSNDVLVTMRKHRRSGPIIKVPDGWRASFDGYESPRFHQHEEANAWLTKCAEHGRWVP